MTTKALFAGALITLLALPAAAQNAPEGTPTRIRGTVEKLDGETLTVKSRDGQHHAVELRIFPEAQRGTAEGQFPWDSMPDSLMTNATVSGVTGAPQGQTLKVT